MSSNLKRVVENKGQPNQITTFRLGERTRHTPLISHAMMKVLLGRKNDNMRR